ncbi:thiamine-phosphate kinase [Sedimenticola sp.]|uniref:thiamine-phosphate kinase n=1 Tax=Sedimenticola sp. TaxID=1940285 RepID=UPI00258E8A12|nr:thiamine-phosphate kinase [Sedimenticola sp.]MCW8902314.1 thiamine-phosphate kinase [Sedimenticola sp.]
MPASEFQLIDDYFSRLGAERADVPLGVGDDCALLRVPEGKLLAVSIDTLVEGTHFLPGADAESLGHKALAVNLSDLAAMGADPAWVTLALTLPRVDEAWIEAFCRGFAVLASRYQVQLVGGDTTRGPLSISVQAHGFVEPGQALRRDAAKPGDLIYVTGTLGDAGLALLAASGGYEAGDQLMVLQRRLDRPEPRIEVAQALRDLATGAIDISDGLLSDLGHICDKSGVGATVRQAAIPLSEPVVAYVQTTGDWSIPLAAGDDYELCLIVPVAHQARVEAAGKRLEVPLRLIGRIDAGSGIRCTDEAGNPIALVQGGYDHFSAS